MIESASISVVVLFFCLGRGRGLSVGGLGRAMEAMQLWSTCTLSS